jgi:hypothetical protein
MNAIMISDVFVLRRYPINNGDRNGRSQVKTEAKQAEQQAQSFDRKTD